MELGKAVIERKKKKYNSLQKQTEIGSWKKKKVDIFIKSTYSKKEKGK